MENSWPFQWYQFMPWEGGGESRLLAAAWIKSTFEDSSSFPTLSNFTSSFAASIDLLFGLPLDLLPASSNLCVPPHKYPLFLLCTWPNHLSLVSVASSPKHATCAVALMHSILVTHQAQHSYLQLEAENVSSENVKGPIWGFKRK